MIGFLSVQLNDDDKNFMLDLYKNYYSLVWKTIFSITHSTEDIED
jgi:RNA polymerase sigma-70 factor (ECF subfamily)